MSKLKAYFWKEHTDVDTGLAVVAKSAKRAKELGYAYWASDVGVEPETFIEQRVNWLRDANVEGLKKETVLEHHEGLRRNMYGWIEDGCCDDCGDTDMLYHHEGKALCSACIEKDEVEVSADSSQS